MTDESEIPVFLTVRETAEKLRINRRTIENRIKAGKLLAKRIAGGQNQLIDQRDILVLRHGRIDSLISSRFSVRLIDFTGKIVSISSIMKVY